ncbi:ABC uncharacterized transporter periplasmic component-like protein [Desulfovibrio sp. X2]|uniref:ABC transporter substrate-binding protein n=1 Tax=Desulfovibrio sp. X2 TaxID=941449 RepID=UPI000358C899|nr:ABC transporter substrate-binding protein [Desulfovibrio sp. X2]EPR37385.1 ABC uncharacterized transporter periplasmic component-like protein [Desulfovibrio sp. X2]
MRRLARLLLPVLLLAATVFAAGPTPAAPAEDASWQAVVARAKGQTVYWNAWAGSEATNDYIDWVSRQVAERYGIHLRHVKISNTAEAVARILAEKSAGKMRGGSVDLIWINGENFLKMRENGLLYGPFADRLPNAKYLDYAEKPTMHFDFTVPVDGMESPWGAAQVVFLNDSRRLPDPPRSMPELLAWAKAHPGRFTHPQVRNFMGSTFLKQALYELVEDKSVLQKPATSGNFAKVTAPLWAWYDQLRPNLWRQGRQFPENATAEDQLLADGEVDMSLSFQPGEASNLIQSGQLPDTVRTFVMRGGTIGNTHFVAIPFNSSAKEAAMVVADFLLSPEAQARKQDPRVWGDYTVLSMKKLSPEQRALFTSLPRGVATLSPEELGTPLPEPHPSWMNMIVAEWERRYGG